MKQVSAILSKKLRAGFRLQFAFQIEKSSYYLTMQYNQIGMKSRYIHLEDTDVGSRSIYIYLLDIHTFSSCDGCTEPTPFIKMSKRPIVVFFSSSTYMVALPSTNKKVVHVEAFAY